MQYNFRGFVMLSITFKLGLEFDFFLSSVCRYNGYKYMW
jgi:hypothetical protein